jgi:hypothetical protein
MTALHVFPLGIDPFPPRFAAGGMRLSFCVFGLSPENIGARCGPADGTLAAVS